MKKVTLHISEDIKGGTAHGGSGTRPITVSFGQNRYGNDLTVGVSSPMGFSMSTIQSADVIDTIRDSYEYIYGVGGVGGGTYSYLATKSESTIIDLLSKNRDVNEVIQYKED